jgi:RNA polymerase sigma factor (TIGR02999 family)
MGEPRTVTRLLRDWRDGDAGAMDELMPLVYAELHRVASAYMRGERAEHTFQPTDLVGEAYVRLAQGSTDYNDRVHFFAAAAKTMRQILVDHARRRARDKRGGGERPVQLDEGLVVSGRGDDLVAVDAALAALAEVDERKARIVELHYFAGLTQAEIGLTLGIHVNTVARDLRLAVAWIQAQLT